MDENKLKSIIEASLLAMGESLSLDQMLQMFDEDSQPEKKELRDVLAALQQDYEGRGMEVIETGSGWRIQVRAEYADWVSRLWEEKPARYSRALLETLALVAYRQPITRGEIEDVRGVSVSSNIMKTLMEREWIRVVGHRDVPGKPALYATTRIFLDYFNLKTLNDLPTLAEIKDLDSINQELALNDPDKLDNPGNDEDSTSEGTGMPVQVSVADDSEEETGNTLENPTLNSELEQQQPESEPERDDSPLKTAESENNEH
jgi:segregation and condensation protein B